MKKYYLLTLIVFISQSFLFVGCGNYYIAEVTVRSEPPGARIYDNYNRLLGRTPIELEFEMAEDEFYGQSSWNCGSVTAYLEGYEPKKKDIILNTSNYEYFGFWSSRKKLYRYNLLINFDTPKSHRMNTTGLVFYTANTGNTSNPRDSFGKNESIEVVLKGYSGKTVEFYIRDISSGEAVFKKSFYIPSDWPGVNSIVGNLSSGSYVLIGVIDGKTRLDDYRFLVR